MKCARQPTAAGLRQAAGGKLRRRVAFCSLALLLVLPASATAGVFRADEKTTKIDGVVDKDLYLATEILRLTGAVNGDVSAAGRRIYVSGTVAGAAALAAESIAIDGSVERAARMAGREIEIEGKVGRDVIAFAEKVGVGKAAAVGHDLVVFSQDLRMEGKVGGMVRGAAATMLIDGEVLGDIDVQAGELELGPNARIAGNLTYGSDRRVLMDDAAVVTGKIRQKAPLQERRPGAAERVFDQVRSMIGPILMGLLLMWLLPPFAPAVAATMRKVTSGSLLTGVGALVLVPVAAMILFFVFTVAGGGWSIPGVMLGAYAAALALSRVMAGYALGQIVLERTKNSTENPQFGQRFAALVLGVVILTILSAIPVIGVFAAFMPVVLTMGAIIVMMVRWRDRLRTDDAPPAPAAPAEAPAPAS